GARGRCACPSTTIRASPAMTHTALCRILLQVVMPIPSKVARRNLVRLHLWHSRYSLFRVLTRDGWLLFLTRCTRLFAYGALSVATSRGPPTGSGAASC